MLGRAVSGAGAVVGLGAANMIVAVVAMAWNAMRLLDAWWAVHPAFALAAWRDDDGGGI